MTRIINYYACYLESKGKNCPIIAEILPNNVYVIILPNGDMRDIVGEEAALKAIKEYKSS